MFGSESSIVTSLKKYLFVSSVYGMELLWCEVFIGPLFWCRSMSLCSCGVHCLFVLGRETMLFSPWLLVLVRQGGPSRQSSSFLEVCREQASMGNKQAWVPGKVNSLLCLDYRIREGGSIWSKHEHVAQTVLL